MSKKNFTAIPTNINSSITVPNSQTITPSENPSSQNPAIILLEKINISRLEKHSENETLLPPLSKDERENLKTRMKIELEPHPFVVMKKFGVTYTNLQGNYVVLDGNNRLSILQEIGFTGEIPCIVKEYMLLEQQRTMIENYALSRRNLTREAKAEIAKRQAARGIGQSEIAKTLGVSQRTISNHTNEIVETRKEAEKEAIETLTRAGMNQTEIAKEIGVTQQTISNITNFSKIAKICNDNKTEEIEDDSEDEPENDYTEELEDQEKIEESEPLPKTEAIAIAKEMLTEEAVLQRVEEKQAAKEDNSKFNFTNDNIEWAKWTWNPITGCRHDCPYCYARDIAMRFEGTFEPKFHEDRLNAPANTKIPKGKENIPGIRNVFVCSMADLFGEWVSDEWINKVFESIKANPQWNYILLTKNPKRYLEIELPKNVWIGATADTQERATIAIEVFKNLDDSNIKFLSCEPLEENILLSDDATNYIDWLIIGGRSKSSKMPEKQPEWEWVNGLYMQAKLNGIKVYFKPNLTIRPREYPK